MRMGTLVVACLALIAVPGCGDDASEDVDHQELAGRPVELPRVDLEGRSIEEFGVAGRCWARGMPDVGAIGLRRIPGEAALGPWPSEGPPTASGSGPEAAGFSAETAEEILRRGPVYAALLGGAPRIAFLSTSNESRRWHRVRTIWLSRPSYDGQVLIRGGRLDRRGRVGFGSGVRPRFELRLPAGSWPRGETHPGHRFPGRPDGWRASQIPTRLRGPGCYAFQVDGEDFSYLLTFAAQGQ
jgi:hypothetical protein